MANYRSILNDAVVNPAIMPGLQCISGQVTLDNTKTATFTIPAKTVIMAVGFVGTGVITPTVSITNDVATITYTATANGTLQYLIYVTSTETITHPDAGTDNIAITPVT